MDKTYCLNCAEESRWRVVEGKLLCLRCGSVESDYHGDESAFLSRLARDRRDNWKDLSRSQIE